MATSAYEAQAACEADHGSYCDASEFMTTEAAACLAEENNFEQGIAPWNVSLLYSSREKTVVWSVLSLDKQLDAGEQSGNEMELHATTGDVLGLYSYFETGY